MEQIALPRLVHEHLQVLRVDGVHQLGVLHGRVVPAEEDEGCHEVEAEPFREAGRDGQLLDEGPVDVEPVVVALEHAGHLGKVLKLQRGDGVVQNVLRAADGLGHQVVELVEAGDRAEGLAEHELDEVGRVLAQQRHLVLGAQLLEAVQAAGELVVLETQGVDEVAEVAVLQVAQLELLALVGQLVLEVEPQVQVPHVDLKQDPEDVVVVPLHGGTHARR